MKAIVTTKYGPPNVIECKEVEKSAPKDDVALIKEEDKKMIQINGIWRKVFLLDIAGGSGFWVANFAISLSPIAAEYRTALSISYFPMLLESLLGGLIIAFSVSYFLLRFFDKIPAKNPILKSVIVSFIVLIIVTILIGGPSSFLATGDVLRYFLIGTIFNVIRFFALGMSIGYLYEKRYGGVYK